MPYDSVTMLLNLNNKISELYECVADLIEENKQLKAANERLIIELNKAWQAGCDYAKDIYGYGDNGEDESEV